MLKPAMILGDHMVLQRQKEIKIWGTGSLGKSVTGILNKATDSSEQVNKEGQEEPLVASAVVSEEGQWFLSFPPQEAARNMSLSITDGIDTLSYQNICIGEVWLAGGQSNMEYFLHYDEDQKEVLEGPMNLDIRFFDYPEVSYEGQLEDYDYSRFGFWRTCTVEDLPYFSAVGYYFAQNLHETLDVPIGIVGCNWGGTTACSWLDPKYLEDNEGKAWLEDYASAIKDLDIEAYKKSFRENPINDHTNPLQADGFLARLMYPGLSREEQLGFLEMMSNGNAPMMPQAGPYYERRPGGLYEVMLKKVAPLSIRGFIWYQGESDADKPTLYGTVLSKMIECWRDLWAEALPFLFVQLAPYGAWLDSNGDDYPEVRNQQEFVSKTVPNTWMISSSDAGMEWDIHPKNKKPIGNRLALLARGHVYGENMLCDPPEFIDAVRVNEGIQINFANASGLHVKGSQVHGFVITDVDRNELLPLSIDVNQEDILLKGDFPEEVTISFANTGYYDVNLYNTMENPLKPFKVTI